jgi:hypothetical protein
VLNHRGCAEVPHKPSPHTHTPTHEPPGDQSTSHQAPGYIQRVRTALLFLEETYGAAYPLTMEASHNLATLAIPTDQASERSNRFTRKSKGMGSPRLPLAQDPHHQHHNATTTFPHTNQRVVAPKTPTPNTYEATQTIPQKAKVRPSDPLAGQHTVTPGPPNEPLHIQMTRTAFGDAAGSKGAATSGLTLTGLPHARYAAPRTEAPLHQASPSGASPQATNIGGPQGSKDVVISASTQSQKWSAWPATNLAPPLFAPLNPRWHAHRLGTTPATSPHPLHTHQPLAACPSVTPHAHSTPATGPLSWRTTHYLSLRRFSSSTKSSVPSATTTPYKKPHASRSWHKPPWPGATSQARHRTYKQASPPRTKGSTSTHG